MAGAVLLFNKFFCTLLFSRKYCPCPFLKAGREVLKRSLNKDYEKLY